MFFPVDSLQRIPQHPGGPKELQVFAKCDEFMSGLMQRLQLEIPPFALKRRVRVSASTAAEGEDGQSLLIAVTGLDNHTNQPYSFIKVSSPCVCVCACMLQDRRMAYLLYRRNDNDMLS
jgi:hypothetical protein